MQNFDAVIIGTGQAGPPLAARLVDAGMKVAIIERKFFGGTCVNTGCIPTKTLVASAYAASIARRAGEFGLQIKGDIGADMKAVKARKDAISEQSRMGVERWMKGLKSCTVYLGHAHFLSSREIVSGDQVLTSERVFINVGGRASVPPFPGLNEVKYLTNSIDDADRFPARASGDRGRKLRGPRVRERWSRLPCSDDDGVEVLHLRSTALRCRARCGASEMPCVVRRYRASCVRARLVANPILPPIARRVRGRLRANTL